MSSLIVVAAVGAALRMDNLTQISNDQGAMREVARHRHTWVIAFLYIGTFGSFIGFGFAFGQVLLSQFFADLDAGAAARRAAQITFLGPLLGSLIRPVGGRLADRIGGARVTLINFLAMTVGPAVVLVASRVATTGGAVHARIQVHASADEVLSRIHAAVGIVEPIDDDSCVLITGADTVETVAVYIGMLGIDFHVEAPDELVEHRREVGER